MHDFVTSHIGHLEKFGSFRYTDIANVDTFYYTVFKKSCCLIPPQVLSEKSLSMVVVQSLSRVQFFVTTWTVTHQFLLSMAFSRQGYWNGLPFPLPGDLPDLRDQTCISCTGSEFFTTEPPRKPQEYQPLASNKHPYKERESLNIRKLLSSWQQMQLFQNSIFCLKAHFITVKILSVVFLDVATSFNSFVYQIPKSKYYLSI